MPGDSPNGFVAIQGGDAGPAALDQRADGGDCQGGLRRYGLGPRGRAAARELILANVRLAVRSVTPGLRPVLHLRCWLRVRQKWRLLVRTRRRSFSSLREAAELSSAGRRADPGERGAGRRIVEQHRPAAQVPAEAKASTLT
jgi:hypothetical protein